MYIKNPNFNNEIFKLLMVIHDSLPTPFLRVYTPKDRLPYAIALAAEKITKIELDVIEAKIKKRLLINKFTEYVNGLAIVNAFSRKLSLHSHLLIHAKYFIEETFDGIEEFKAFPRESLTNPYLVNFHETIHSGVKIGIVNLES